ncbi:MAG: AI-2E family transporter [Anaerovoracaceae bacterium]
MKLNFDEKHVRWGLTAFLVVVSCTIVFFAIYRVDGLARFANVIMRILTPFIYGLVFAYLLCPIYNFTTRHTFSFIDRRKRKSKRALSFSKVMATIVSLIFFFIVIAGISWMIIPGLVDNIMKVVNVLPDSMSRLGEWLDAKTVRYPEMQATLENWINKFTENVMTYVNEKMLPGYLEIASSISTGVFGVLNLLKNFFVGVVICVYFLNSKELFAAQSKKLILATFNNKSAEEILSGATFTNKTFGGFINGKLIDSLIVGIICFIVMSVFGWEYPLLISCIIGITNIIPFFGPFVGAIPSALLILMVDPMQCVYFLIFILILQQIDGNILGPKILGDSTGLSSFWVMFAILVGGGLFGFMGMIIGIPIFAVIYAYCARAVNKKLDKKGFSVDIRDYTVDRYRIEHKKKEKKYGIKNDLKK